MLKLRVWWSRALELVFGRSRDRRLADEIAAHMDLLTEEHIARGMSPDQARLAARRAFGGVDQMVERYRDRRGLPLVDGLAQDVRFALRLIHKDGWFSAAVVTALSLGLAISTTMVTIVYGMNLRPLPFDRPGSLVAIGAEPTRTEGANVPFSVFEVWRSAARSVAGVAAHVDTMATVGDDTHAADQFVATFISHDGFAVLGVRPVLGRDFRPEDDRPGAPGVVILRHGLWIEWFGSNPSAIGRTVRVNGEPATVIGVMPEGIRFPVWTDVWRPLAALPVMRSPEGNQRPVRIVARLEEAVTPAQARAELESIAATLPAMTAAGRTRPPIVLGLNESMVGRIDDPMPLLLLSAVAVVLLIACVHAANLLLARSAARAREVSLRAALGASRWRIVRQLLVESALLSVAAGAIGFALATYGVGWFAAETAGFGLPSWTRYELDARLFAGLAAIALGTGLVCGVLPAWHLSRTNLTQALNQSGRQGGTGPHARRMTKAILIAELSLTVVLLTCAGLLVRSANVLYQADQRIDLANLWEFRLSLPQPQYASGLRRADLYRRIDERLAAGPGMQSAALASQSPFAGGERRVVSDGAAASVETARTTRVIGIGSRYFDTLGVRVLRGVALEQIDEPALREAALVNERFVEVFSPDRDAIGRRFVLIDDRVRDPAPLPVTIAGIAPAIRQEQNGDHQPVVYLPHRRTSAGSSSILIRGNPDAFAEPLRQAVRAIDPDLPIYGLRPLARVSEVSRWYQRVSSLMFSVFAGAALILSALGLYAITAYAVSRRTQEIGIRMAVGARASQVLWLFIRGALVEVSIGLVLGVAGALGAGAVLSGLLVRTSAADPWTIGAVCLLLTVVALGASLVPARRAARLDPIATLRHD